MSTPFAANQATLFQYLKALSACWNGAASAPGDGAMAPMLGNSLLIASNAGSMLVSEPPFILAISTMNAVPRLEPMPVIPTRPLYSGFHRSSQDVGGAAIF